MNTILTDDERRAVANAAGPFVADQNLAVELAVLAKLREQEPKMSSKRSDAYNNIDRFLRNNLDDTDYDTFSRDLETVLAAPQPAVVQVPREWPNKQPLYDALHRLIDAAANERGTEDPFHDVLNAINVWATAMLAAAPEAPAQNKEQR